MGLTGPSSVVQGVSTNPTVGGPLSGHTGKTSVPTPPLRVLGTTRSHPSPAPSSPEGSVPFGSRGIYGGRPRYGLVPRVHPHWDNYHGCTQGEDVTGGTGRGPLW